MNKNFPNAAESGQLKKFVLNVLLNYITLGVAGVAFILLLVVLIWKRKNLSAKEKGLLSVLLIILALYFAFVIVVSITAGSGHPAGNPTPVVP